MAELTRRAAQAALWSMAEISSRYGVQLVVTVALARLLTPDDFGLIAILMVFTSIGTLLTDAGFGTALIQKRETTQDDETTVFFVTLCTGTVAALTLWRFAGAIASFYDMPDLLPVMRVIPWMLPLGALGAVPDALLTKRLDFRHRTRAQVISSLASAVVAITLAWYGWGIWSLVGQSLVDTGLRTVLLWLFSKWQPQGRFRLASLRVLFGFGGYMLLSGLLSTISTRIQSLVIGKLFNAQELGYYSLAQSTPQAPANFIGALLNRVGLPLFVSLASDQTRLRAALRMTLQVSIFCFLPCMAGIALIARPLIRYVYGEQWSPAAPMLGLLALAASLWPVHVLNLVALNAQGRSDLFFRLEIVKNLVTVAATLAAVVHGPTAVAGAMLLASLCSAAINMWYSGRMLAYGPIAQLLDQWKTLLAASFAALPGWLVLHELATSLGATAGAIAAAAATYLMTAMLLRHPALGQLREVAMHIRLRSTR